MYLVLLVGTAGAAPLGERIWQSTWTSFSPRLLVKILVVYVKAWPWTLKKKMMLYILFNFAVDILNYLLWKITSIYKIREAEYWTPCTCEPASVIIVHGSGWLILFHLCLFVLPALWILLRLSPCRASSSLQDDTYSVAYSHQEECNVWLLFCDSTYIYNRISFSFFCFSSFSLQFIKGFLMEVVV